MLKYVQCFLVQTMSNYSTLKPGYFLSLLIAIDQTDTYVFLTEIFVKSTEGVEFECIQRLFLTSEIFSKLIKSGERIRSQKSEISDSVENKDKA